MFMIQRGGRKLDLYRKGWYMNIILSFKYLCTTVSFCIIGRRRPPQWPVANLIGGSRHSHRGYSKADLPKVNITWYLALAGN